MSSLLRFAKSIGIIASVCILLILAFFLTWQLSGAESGYRFVIRNLLSGDFAGDDIFAKEMAIDLVFEIQQTVLFCIGIIFLASAAWLAFANFVPVTRPGEARNWVWVWFAILISGAVASGAIPSIMFLMETDLLRADQIMPSVFLSIIIYGIVFFVFGSLLATPAHMRTAVPLATKFKMGA